MDRTGKAERDAAFTAFVEQATPSLLRTAWLLTGDHEAPTTSCRRRWCAPTWRGRGCAPRRRVAYARRILVNERTDRWRRHGAELAVAAPPDSASAPASATEDRDVVVRLLATLPEQQRKVVVLRYYTDLSEQATADALNISVGSVKSAASRGLATLRTHLAAIEGGVR